MAVASKRRKIADLSSTHHIFSIKDNKRIDAHVCCEIKNGVINGIIQFEFNNNNTHICASIHNFNRVFSIWLNDGKSHGPASEAELWITWYETFLEYFASFPDKIVFTETSPTDLNCIENGSIIYCNDLLQLSLEYSPFSSDKIIISWKSSDPYAVAFIKLIIDLYNLRDEILVLLKIDKDHISEIENDEGEASAAT